MKTLLLISTLVWFCGCSTRYSIIVEENPKPLAYAFLDDLRLSGVDSILLFETTSGCVVPEKVKEVYILWNHNNECFARMFNYYGSSIIASQKFLNQGIYDVVEMKLDDGILKNPPYEVGCRIDYCKIFFPNREVIVEIVEHEQYLNPKANQVLLIDKVRSLLLELNPSFQDAFHFNLKQVKRHTTKGF